MIADEATDQSHVVGLMFQPLVQQCQPIAETGLGILFASLSDLDRIDPGQGLVVAGVVGPGPAPPGGSSRRQRNPPAACAAAAQ